MPETQTGPLVRRVQENLMSLDEVRERRENGTLPSCMAFAARVLAECAGWTSEADDVFRPVERESQPEHQPPEPADLASGATVGTEPQDVAAPLTAGALEQPVLGVHAQESNPAGDWDA